MKIKNSGGRGLRVVASIGAVALGLMGAAAFAAPASAASNMPTGNGSITVHKYAQPAEPTGLPNDGTLIPADNPDLMDLTALEGVVYLVQKVGNVDLTTNGWDLITGPPPLTPALVGNATYPLAAGTSVATDINGVAPFPNLPIGLYLVTESSPGGNQIPQLADPFLVTIPLPSANNTWLTDVHVYPKNPLADVDKTVDDSTAHGLGDTVNWTITAGVPLMAEGQTLDSFEVTDTLDARLTYLPTATVTFATAGGVNVPLVAGDYTITAPAAPGGTLSVEFEASGMLKLAANQGGTVTVDIATTVTSIGTGTIPNSAVVNINGSTFTSTPVETKWGALKIFKHAATAQQPLAGAKFQVFTSLADANADPRVNQVDVNGATTFTSDAAGNITIDGLKAGAYWIVETTAPAGYQANTVPIAVTIVAGSIAQAQTVSVANTQVPPYALPLTGSSGTLLFVGGGLALIAIALGAALVLSRRKSHLAHAVHTDVTQ